MKTKAVMCDIDGTLLSSNGIVTPKTIEAIKKLREHRILFGISTGRDVPSVKHLLKVWELMDLLILWLAAMAEKSMIMRMIIMR